MERGGDLVFFLGGADLEMLEIRRLLEEFAPDSFRDKGLQWGAKASDYREEIERALAEGKIPTLIELEDDLGLPEERVLVVDHHDLEHGAELPSALRQIFELLGLEERHWTRRRELVSANDKGHVRGLQDAGADPTEARAIRREDRAAQGITAEQERQARQACAAAEELADGRLTVVRCPHSRAAAVTDTLDGALGGPGYQNLLVVSPGEVNFFGAGDLVRVLDKAFPGGWRGGNLPQRGFWGRRFELGEGIPERALAALLAALSEPDLDSPGAAEI